MKNTLRQLILASSILFSVSAFSQMSVLPKSQVTLIGKIAPMGNKTASLEKYEGDSIVLSYLDMKYSTLNVWKNFGFNDVDGALDKFYTVVIDGFDNLPSEPITLDFPNDTVSLYYTKNMGIISMKMFSKNKASGIDGETPYFTKKQINKLFGKI